MVQPNTEQPASDWSVPSGYVPLKVTDETSTIFDYDNIRSNPNLHLWAFRVPFNLTAKHLKDVVLDFSADLSSPVLATLTRKDKHYSVSPSVPLASADALPGLPTVAAGELASLTCLLPRSSKGDDKLVIGEGPRNLEGRGYVPNDEIRKSAMSASKPIQRHFVVSLSEVEPDRPVIPPTGSIPRRPQPTNRLIHVFRPVGSRATLLERETVSETVMPQPSSQPMLSPKGPSKKRKASSDPRSSPPKQRKHVGNAS